MNINFSKVIIENFLSFGYAEIDLKDRGYTLVNGVNNNPGDLAVSNGSGKSSIWEAISWCLTGETIRGIKTDVVNIHTKGGCVVELYFSVGSDNYKVCRYKDHKEFKTNLKIYINEQDRSGKGIRDSEKLLAEYLPDLTSALIGSVIILGQGLPQRFSNNTPSGRKEVLEKLSKSDFMIDDLKSKLTSRKSVLSALLRRYEDEDLSLNTQVKIAKDRLTELTLNLNSLGTADHYIDIIKTVEKEVEALNERIAEITASRNDLQTSLECSQNERNSILSKINENVNLINSQYEVTRRDLNDEKAKVVAEESFLRKEVNRLENIKDVCPTCGQKLPDVHKPDTTEQKVVLSKLAETLEKLEEKIAESKKQQLLEIAKIKDSLQEREIELANTCNLIRRKLDDSNIIIARYHEELRSKTLVANTAKVNKEQLESRKVEIEDSIITAENCVSELSDKIVYNNIDKDETRNRLDVVNKMLSIASRDFRGYLLTNVISFIDKKSKEYAQDIFETTKIEFALDGNNINISYDNKQYENLSGGEKQKVDIIVQFAIRDMLCQFSNFSCNILVLDEIFDNLDSIGCQKVIDLISKRLTDIESVFIITHHKDIELPVDSTITIIKDKSGISRVK